MTTFQDQEDDVIFNEPIQAKKDCKIKITFAELTEWKVKDTVTGYEGQQFPAMKLTIMVIDPDVHCEHPDARPRVIEDQFNLEKYPYLDKKTAEVKWLGRQKVYDLEQALGFEPLFVVNGERVEPYVTRNGNKVAPKTPGVKRKLNPEFASAYFDGNGIPKVDNWIDKELLADIEVEKSEQYGDKNVIKRYKKLS